MTPTPDPPDLNEIWDAIAELAAAYGAAPLNQHPKPWYVRLDSKWELAINGHDKPAECRDFAPPVTIPIFCAYVQYNGWPAAMIDPAGAEIAAGRAANAHTMLAAIRGATARVKRTARPI